MQQLLDLYNTIAVNIVILQNKGFEFGLVLKTFEYEAQVTAIHSITVKLKPLQKIWY